jgi:hypothetical protein
MNSSVTNKSVLNTKITVNFKHQGRVINSEIEPYKKIKSLYDKAKDLFIHLKKIKLLHVNKDLNKYCDYSISDFIKNKNSIIITVEEEEIIFKNPLFKQNVEKQSDSSKNIIQSDEFKCSLCEKNEIFSYCRNCNNFICKSCFINNHQTHKILKINSKNLFESLKEYQDILLSDLILNVKAFGEYKNEYLTQNILDPSARKEIIIRKLDKIEEMFKEKLHSKEGVTFGKTNETEIIENKTEILKKDILRQIENFSSNSIKESKAEVPLDQVKKLFRNLQIKENECNDLIQNISSFKFNMDLSVKIDNMFKLVEKSIDTVLLAGNELDKKFGSFDSYESTNSNIFNTDFKSQQEQNDKLKIYKNFNKLDIYNSQIKKKNLQDDEMTKKINNIKNVQNTNNSSKIDQKKISDNTLSKKDGIKENDMKSFINGEDSLKQQNKKLEESQIKK